MTHLIVYLLFAFGLAYIVGHAKISLKVRTLLADIGGPFLWVVELLECPVCFGFWTGVAISFASPGARSEFSPFGSQHLSAVWIGAMTSGSNFIVGRLTNLIVEDP